MTDATVDDLLAIERLIEGLPADKLRALVAMPEISGKLKTWIPNPGPQTLAYECAADELLFGGEAGGGKAININELVPTPHGWTSMGEIAVGDLVFDETGAQCKVVAVTPVLRGRPCYRLVFSDGAEIIADAEHQWVTLSNAERSGQLKLTPQWRASRRETRPTRSTHRKPWLATANKDRVWVVKDRPDGAIRTTAIISKTLKVGKRINHSIDVAKSLHCQDADVLIEPYILGVWLGDGSSYKAEITTADAEIVAQVGGSSYAISHYGGYAYGVTGGLKTALRQLGLIANKHIPPAYLRASETQRLALLQGLMDTDGTCGKNGHCSFTTTKHVLANNVAELILSLGIKVAIKVGVAKLNGREIGPKYTLKFLTEKPVFRLARKRLRQKRGGFRGTHDRRYIVAVEPIDSVPVRCIQVDSASHQYLVGRSMIPTHNSDLLIGLAMNEHHSSRILRRINQDAYELGDRLVEIIGSDDGYSRNPAMWRGPNGKRIEFKGCELERDKQRFKGKARDLICVAKGTLVRMADGSHKPIETLAAGEMLATLEGPRRLERVYPSQRKPCVEVTATDWMGRVIAKQRQSLTHALWSGESWISAADQGAVCASTSRRNDGNIELSLLPRCSSLLRSLVESIGRFQCNVAGGLGFFGHHDDLAVPASGPRISGKSAGRVFDGWFSKWWRLGANRGQQELRQHSGHSVGPIERRPVDGRATPDARGTLTPASYSGDCFAYFHRCDERLPFSSYLSMRRGDGQQCLLLRDDAVQPIPSRWLVRGLAQIRRYTHSHLRKYVHPYTKEIRRVAESCSLPHVAALEFLCAGELEVYDIQVSDVRHYITYGGFVNKNCYDELADFLESQYVFINTWNRSAIPGQRCRIVGATNGPTTAEGMWIVKRWAAWLDPNHPNRARDGELRWYIRVDDHDIEFDGPGPHMVRDRLVKASSRTFIRSRLENNPDLSDTDYGDRLESLPEELRRVYRGGDFTVGLRDDDFQVIPTAWVDAAMQRWTPQPPMGMQMTAMAVDVAPGGGDKRVIATRYGGWFDKLDVAREVDKTGRKTASAIVGLRRDNCPVVVDMGGGWGGDASLAMRDNGIAVLTYMGVDPSHATSRDGKLRFVNKRAETIWKFREELDPSQEGGSSICLPPDDEMKADLASFRWELRSNGILIEGKEKIKTRIGRSPDRGEAVVMCLEPGNAAIRRAISRGAPPKVILAYQNSKRRR